MGMKDQCRVTIVKSHFEQQILWEPEKPLLELLLKNKIEISHSCGGFGSCGTCRVFVENYVEKPAPPEGIELEMALDRQFQGNERLSCQLFPAAGMVVRIPSIPSEES